MSLNFDAIKERKTIVGGLEGKLAVKLVGFDVKPDKNGNNNYQFKLALTDLDNKVINYNCGESFYTRAVSNIGTQLGFEKSSLVNDVEILKKASKETFYIWRENGYTNFYDRNEWIASQTEEAPDLA